MKFVTLAPSFDKVAFSVEKWSRHNRLQISTEHEEPWDSCISSTSSFFFSTAKCFNGTCWLNWTNILLSWLSCLFSSQTYFCVLYSTCPALWCRNVQIAQSNGFYLTLGCRPLLSLDWTTASLMSSGAAAPQLASAERHLFTAPQGHSASWSHRSPLPANPLTQGYVSFPSLRLSPPGCRLRTRLHLDSPPRGTF